MMTRDETIQTLSKVGKISVSYAEDLYDSFVPKPIVPQFVADWYEDNNGDLNGALFIMVRLWDEKSRNSDFYRWFRKDKEAFQTLVNMHQFGYEVEEETKYRIKMKAARYNGFPQFLCEEDRGIFWGSVFDCRKTKFTRKELESNGFGWVFNCEGVEVKEVTNE